MNRLKKNLSSKIGWMKLCLHWTIKKYKEKVWFVFYSIGVTKNKPYDVLYEVTSSTSLTQWILDRVAASDDSSAIKMAIGRARIKHPGCLIEINACCEAQNFFLWKRKAVEFEAGSSAASLAEAIDKS